MLRNGLKRRRHGRSYVAVVVYLVVFALLLTAISHFYLIPAMEAAQRATPMERRLLAVHSGLLLMVLLFVLFAFLLVTFRWGRGYRRIPRRKPTVYPDAWAESARRIKIPPSPPPAQPPSGD